MMDVAIYVVVVILQKEKYSTFKYIYPAKTNDLNFRESLYVTPSS